MWGKWGKPTWLISDTNQFHLNIIYASIVRLWQMRKGPVGGIWEIAANELTRTQLKLLEIKG